MAEKEFFRFFPIKAATFLSEVGLSSSRDRIECQSTLILGSKIDRLLWPASQLADSTQLSVWFGKFSDHTQQKLFSKHLKERRKLWDLHKIVSPSTLIGVFTGT